jgi:hypothetical protein
MAISEVELTYLLLILMMIGAFGGWLLKVAVDESRADLRREAEAEERRREYERSVEESYIAECEERIKELNRQNTMYWWLSEVKGGANK